MRINNNLMAMNAHRQLKTNTMGQQKSLEKLSSGYRINRAGDDAAGLAISEKMRGQIRGLNQASRNAQDSISMIQTAEGSMTETHSILQRMRELAVQAANDTQATGDRQQIAKELTELRSEINRIGSTTEFNNKKLFTGGLSTTGAQFQVGANDGQSIAVKIGTMNASALGLTISIGGVVTAATSAGSISATIATLDTAIEKVSSNRASLGSKQNRLEHTIANLDTAAENLQAAESRIRDVDMAQEMMTYTKNNILNQAATAMLAQANQAPQGVLQLLR